MGKISKSLLVFILLSATYTLLMMKYPGLNATQNENQTNLIKAEEYLYGARETWPVTVIGTSLAARLYTDSLPGFYNLAFGAMSMNDGLAIVNHSEQKPRLLLLETNAYWKPPNNQFLELVFNPVNYQFKKFLLSFHSNKQPIALATSGTIKVAKDLKRGVSGTPKSVAREKDIFDQKLFEYFMATAAKLPDTSQVSLRLKIMKKEISALQAQGVEIVFLEIPYSSQLSQSVQSRYTRRAFKEAFPPSRYNYVPYRDWNFKTVDGLHMTNTEALVFTKYLKAWYLNGEYNPDGTALTPKD